MKYQIYLDFPLKDTFYYLSYHIFPCEKTGFMQSNVSKKTDISEMMSLFDTMLKQ